MFYIDGGAMSLQIIAGPSGCGKSTYAYKELIEEAVKKPDERFFVIVPEQFTMQAQRELTDLHPGHTILNIDILSFNRLAYRVFEETGGNQAPILEDMGKILILQKLINDNKKDLSILDGMFNKSGAAARINSQLSEFCQYDIDLETLDTENERYPELLKRKLRDLKCISKAFSEYMEGRYLTAEEVPVVLSGVIEKADSLKGSTVIFDGFTGFVPTQYHVVEKLMKICKKVTVVATSDRKAGLRVKSAHSNLFNMTHQMVTSLIGLADKNGVDVLSDIWIDDAGTGRFRDNEALAFLEKTLFRYEYKKYTKTQDSVYITGCKDPEQEIERAAEIILKLVRTGRYRYRDFAFVTANIEEYAEKAGNIFEANDIPIFLDKKSSIMSNPAVEFVRAAVDMATDGLSYKSTFRFLKTGLTLINEDIDLFENYVLAFAIKGPKAYEKEWSRTSVTMSQDVLPKVNKIRSSFVAYIYPFLEGFKKKNASVRQRTSALYELIEKSELQKSCKELEERFTKENDPARAKEFSQIYKIIMDFLDKLVEILGEENVSEELYRKLIETGFSQIQLGMIPTNRDRVVVGDIERTRLKNVKVMFFAGLNDGIVPEPVSRESILSETDRKLFQSEDIRLAPDSREEMYRQRLYLYLNLTKPSDKLFLSYSFTDTLGEALLPSYLINVIRDTFEKIPSGEYAADDMLRLESSTGRQELLLEGFSAMDEKVPDDRFNEIVSFLEKNEKGMSYVEKLISAALYHKPDTYISKEAAALLYGVNTGFSASRLEKYGSCPFRHFLEYGAALKEREVFEFSPADIGSILHSSVKRFCDMMDEAGWDMKKEDVEIIADKAFDISYGEYENAMYSSSRSFDEMRLKKINRITAWCVFEQTKRSGFVPLASEERFITEGVKGIVDRIDICRRGDVNYIRVIDYKSSAREPDLNKFYNRIQIQLPLYLTAANDLIGARDKNKKTEPAGIYYYNMTEPMIEVESLDEKITDEQRLKQLRLSGISRKEPEILMMLDNTLEPGVKSVIIPAEFNAKPDKNGDIIVGARSKVCSLEDFCVLEKYTKHMIKGMRKEIENGKAAIEPKDVEGTDSCTYCPFLSVCGFDVRIPGYRKKRCGKLSDEEALKKMLDELTEEGNLDGNQLDR